MKQKVRRFQVSSKLLHEKAHGCGIRLLDSIANNGPIDQAAKEYAHALKQFRRTAVAEVGILRTGK